MDYPYHQETNHRVWGGGGGLFVEDGGYQLDNLLPKCNKYRASPTDGIPRSKTMELIVAVRTYNTLTAMVPSSQINLDYTNEIVYHRGSWGGGVFYEILLSG